MKRTSERRKTANLPQSLHRKLEIYGLAAAAAGVGMAALSSSAQAEVVFTPAHQEIGRHGIGLDLNNDGFPEFTIQPRVFRSDAGMVVYSLGSNRVLATAGSFVANLAAGYQVGPNSNFRRGGSFSSFKVPGKFLYDCAVSSGIPPCFGPWDKNTPGGFIGLKFSLYGELHYGWARLKVVVKGPDEFRFFLTGYAYETIPNKPIVIGERNGSDDAGVKPPDLPAPATRLPATLGMLSAGSSALSIWRPSPQ